MTAVSTINRLTLLQEIFAFGGDCIVKGLTKIQFKQLAARYPELQMEREKNGNIHIMAPVKGGSGIREVKLSRRIGNWCEANVGGEIFSPSTGFDLPNGATKSPDVAWVSAEKFELDLSEFKIFKKK